MDTLPPISPEIALSPHYASAKYTTIDEDEYDKLDKKEQEVLIFIVIGMDLTKFIYVTRNSINEMTNS